MCSLPRPSRAWRAGHHLPNSWLSTHWEAWFSGELRAQPLLRYLTFSSEWHSMTYRTPPPPCWAASELPCQKPLRALRVGRAILKTKVRSDTYSRVWVIWFLGASPRLLADLLRLRLLPSGRPRIRAVNIFLHRLWSTTSNNSQWRLVGIELSVLWVWDPPLDTNFPTPGTTLSLPACSTPPFPWEPMAFFGLVGGKFFLGRSFFAPISIGIPSKQS